jgi:hypothetical protein
MQPIILKTSQGPPPPLGPTCLFSSKKSKNACKKSGLQLRIFAAALRIISVNRWMGRPAAVCPSVPKANNSQFFSSDPDIVCFMKNIIFQQIRIFPVNDSMQNLFEVFVKNHLWFRTRRTKKILKNLYKKGAVWKLHRVDEKGLLFKIFVALEGRIWICSKNFWFRKTFLSSFTIFENPDTHHYSLLFTE